MLKKITYFVIAGVLSAAMILGSTACSCNNDEKKPEDPVNSNPVQSGEHESVVESTDGFIVKDGKTDYKILVPDEASETISSAVSELTQFFKTATGIQLETVKDSARSQNGKYLSVGKTELFKSTGTVFGEKFGRDGFRLITRDENVFMCGNEDIGSVYAVYEFLNRALGFEVYYKDCISLDKDVKELKLYNYNITEIPDFVQRATGTATMSGNPTYLQRAKMNTWADNFMQIDGAASHNSLEILNPNGNGKDHRDWFMDGSIKQLCYTAHGNAEEYSLMVNEAAKVLCDNFKVNPDKTRVQISIEDNRNWCGCQACQQSKATYGTESAAVITFCNDVSGKVSEWMASEEGKEYARDFSIFFLAYEKVEDAPVTYNEATKEYEATIRCASNVCPLYAPIFIDYTSSIHDSINSQYKETMRKWGSVADNIYLWTYSTNFNYYLVMYDNFANIQEWYRFVNECGVKMIRDQSQSSQNGGSTGFQILKQYLQSKLSWNINYNVEELVNNFFTNYFGEGAEAMRKMFNDTRVQIATLKNRKSDAYGGIYSVYQEVKKTDFWPKPILMQLYGYTDEAMEKIAPLKFSDVGLYNEYYDHIAMERLSVVYLLHELYKGSVNPTELAEMTESFKADVIRLGITNESEHVGISGLLSSM